MSASHLEKLQLERFCCVLQKNHEWETAIPSSGVLFNVTEFSSVTNASFPPSSLVQMQECQKLRRNELPGHRANQSRATTVRVRAMSMIYDCSCWLWSPDRGVVYQVSPLCCKIILCFPLSILNSLEGSHFVKPTPREWAVMFHLLEERVII